MSDEVLSNIKKLLTKFEVIDCDLSPHTAGIGIGLTISHLLAILLGKSGL